VVWVEIAIFPPSGADLGHCEALEELEEELRKKQ
jgi:hypothetical protein